MKRNVVVGLVLLALFFLGVAFIADGLTTTRRYGCTTERAITLSQALGNGFAVVCFDSQLHPAHPDYLLMDKTEMVYIWGAYIEMDKLDIETLWIQNRFDQLHEYKANCEANQRLWVNTYRHNKCIGPWYGD